MNEVNIIFSLNCTAAIQQVSAFDTLVFNKRGMYYVETQYFASLHDAALWSIAFAHRSRGAKNKIGKT